MTDRRRGALFDVDGTLVDTNFLHTVAWWQAFRSCGHQVTTAAIHRTIGQGSDKLIETLIGRDDADVRRAHTSFYAPFLEQLAPFPGASGLLRECAERGLTVVLATSAAEHEAARMREALDAEDAIDAVTDKGDVDRSKPDPDILQAALDQTGLQPADVVFVGDTVWDAEAAKKVGVECVCVLTGGVSEAELRAAGAVDVYRDVRHLREELDASPLGRLASRGQ